MLLLSAASSPPQSGPVRVRVSRVVGMNLDRNEPPFLLAFRTTDRVVIEALRFTPNMTPLGFVACIGLAPPL